jgi:hypothetical protein
MTAELHMPRSGLDLKQYGFDLTTQVLRGVWFADFACPRFSDMLWSPVSFDRR